MLAVDTWELVAREAIRDLVARYNANGDAGRIDQVVELFAPDAVMEIEDREYAGHEAIRGMFGGVVKDVRAASDSRTGRPVTPVIHHHTSSLQIDVHDERSASSRCYLQVLMTHGLDHWGRYVDDYGVREGRWVFTRRRVRVDGTTPGGWASSLTSRP